MLLLMAYPEDGGGWAPDSVIDHSVGHEDQYQYQYQSAGDWAERSVAEICFVILGIMSYLVEVAQTVFNFNLLNIRSTLKKSPIRETKHLSTHAESSTDTIGGWTKNTPKPIFFGKMEKII